MYIPGHDDLVVFLTAGQDHGLDRRRGAADHEKCVVRSERVRRQFLRLFDHGDRVAQIVQRLHGIHVNADAPLPEKLHQLPPMLVSRNVKGDHPVPAEPFQRLVDRRSFL